MFWPSAGSPFREARTAFEERPRDESTVSAERLVGSVYNAETPRREQVAAALEGLSDPAEAWERLDNLGLTPPSWMQGLERRFGSHIDDLGDGRARGERRRRVAVSAQPTSLALVEAMASRGTLIARAEALALEAITRASRAPRVIERVVWSTRPRGALDGPRGTLLSIEISLRLQSLAARSAVLDRAYLRAFTEVVRRAPGDALVSAAARDHARALLWRLGDAEASNPYGPLVGLWLLGVVPDTVEDATVFLTVPPVAPCREGATG